MKPIATLLLLLNFCMFAVILGIGGWAMNTAIDHGFVIGKIHRVSSFLFLFYVAASLMLLL